MLRKLGFKVSNLFLIMILVFISFSLFKIFFYPVYIDEAITYNDYVINGFWKSLSSYKEPNNHVLYSLLLVAFTKLPIETLIAMRLLNLCISLFIIVVMYRFLQKKFSFEASIIGVCVFMFSYFFLFYTIFARGYLIIILCTISYFFILEEMRRQITNKHFITMGLVTVLGFCTVPIFLYVFLSFIVIIIFRFVNKVYPLKLIFLFMITFFISGICVFLFYLPILLHDGINAIVNNKWTAILCYNDVFSYLKNSWSGFYDKIFGVKSIFIMLFIVLTCVYLIIKSKQSRLYLIENLIFIFLPFIFILLHKVVPGVRTWSYLTVPFTFILTFFLEYFFKYFIIKRSTKLILVLVLCFLLGSFQLIIFHRSHKISGHINDFYYGKVAEFLINNNVEHICFLNGFRSYENVIYKFHLNKVNDNYKSNKDNNIKCLTFVGYITSINTLKVKRILYIDKKINICVYQL
ncbi:MAG: hypothetical protein KA210_01710 [Bacteroidia bacterium]|nr:hypothetical protein [Bacteroidia bacterium]